MKKCIKCGNEKELRSFPSEKWGGKIHYRGYCKECRNGDRKNNIAKIIEMPDTKKCSVCGECKPLDRFNKSYSGKYGRDNRCTTCKVTKTHERYRDCPPDYSKLIKINGTIIKKCTKCLILKNINEFNSNMNNIDHLNHSCVICIREYRQFPENKKRRSNLKRIRHSEDPSFRLRSNVSASIIHYLKGDSKSNKSLQLLGINTIEEYRNYLEDQFGNEFTWENYGTEWQIDHIIPISAFDLSNSSHQTVAFNKYNTRPLNRVANAKRIKYVVSENDLKLAISNGLVIPIEVMEYLNKKTIQ